VALAAGVGAGRVGVGALAAGRAGAALGAGVAPAIFTPPCRAHAPRPALLLVPSPQVTIAAAGFDAAAGTAAAAGAAFALLAAFCSAFAAVAAFFVALLSTPP
jgi:hypothetical protein